MKKALREWVWLGWCSLLIVMMIGGAGRAWATEVKIGEIDPLTGKLAKHGIEIHQGILLAVEQANRRGGVKGRTIRLIARDDQSRPEVAVNQVEDLIYREKVVGLVGGYVDSLVGPVSRIASKHRVPYVASASLQRALTRRAGNPFFFRVSRLQGIVEPLLGFVTDVVKPGSAAILYAATPGATEFSRELRQRLQERGIAVPVFDKFRPGTSDFTPLLLKVRQSGAQVLVAAGFFPDHLILVRQFLRLKVPLKAYIGPWGVAYPGFIKALGGDSENLVGMCAWNPGITLPGTEVESRRFVNAFVERFHKQPNTTAMHGYTSARALIEALRKVAARGRELSGANIAAALRKLDLTLPMERLQFDDHGDPLHYRQVVVQIRKGSIVAVYPPERATGRFAPLAP